jgi:hypothetical protein
MRCAKATGLFFALILVLAGAGQGEEQQKQGQAPEPELTIVKYGSVVVKSEEPGVKVYIDDSYKGGTDEMIESVVVGEHVIACRAGEKAISGTFQIKKNETLRLEARFDEGKLAVYRESAKPEPVKAEVEKKRPEASKREKPNRPAVEVKKADQKNPVEERRRAHLNVMRLDYEVSAAPDVRVEHTAPPAVVKCTVKKDKAGKYYRTKQGVLLCDTGPCELTWIASFIYTDETGRTDALLLNWKEVVFNGITPKGTSRRELECCLNGQCRKMEDNTATDTTQEYELGRYQLSWTKTSVLVRRADILQEITAAGRSLSDY